MRISTSARFLVLVLLAAAVTGAAGVGDRGRPALAGPTATITIGQPDGVDDVVGNGDDFATTVLGDPWDMSEPTDIMAIHHIPNACVSNGILSFTKADDRTKVPLLFAGFEGRFDVSKIGMNYPIDSSVYHWLSLRMYHPAGKFRVRWTYGRFGDSSRAWVETTDYVAEAGWHTYVIDLNAAGIAYTDGGATGWNGMVPQISIVSRASAGDTVQIDWARLTTDNPLSNDLDITWSGLSPTPNELTFRIDDDTTGCDGPIIYIETYPGTGGTFSWQQATEGVASPSNVAPGDYYVCARADGAIAGYSTGQLSVSQSPIFRFTQPSFTSGNDYATEAGNTWDMGDRSDVDRVVNGSYTTDGDVTAVTVSSSQKDVQVYLDTPGSIDRTKYYYLTYRLWFDYPYETRDVGQNTRIFWGRSPYIETTSELIYDYPGWQTYTVDLRSLPLWSGPNWNKYDWGEFRIDPIANHTGEQVTFYLDDILLTGDETADGYVDVMWDMTDPDTSVTTMTLYYDTDQTGMDGVPITTLSLEDGEQTGTVGVSSVSTTPDVSAVRGLTETFYLPLVMNNYVSPCQGACYTWYTSDMDPGPYYLYACVDDGYNQFCRYSEAPVQISH